MNQKKITVTIGITAYNEAENIGVLLQALLEQKLFLVVLEKIIVVSDGSSDATVAVATQIKDDRIVIVDSKKRLGQAARQNEIFELSATAVVILLNADVLPVTDDCIEEICKPFQNANFSGMVGAKPVPLSINGSFISKTLDWSANWKQSLFEKMAQKNNIYLCHGRARAFSKDLYTKLRWPKFTAEDAFSYIFTKMNNFDFCYQPSARIWFVSPQSLKDHISQSERFFYSKDEIAKDTEIKQKNRNWYKISYKLLIKEILKSILKNPIYSVSYIGIVGFVVVLNKINGSKKRTMVWQPSTSTKSLKS